MFRSKLSLLGIAMITALVLSDGAAVAVDLDSANNVMRGCTRNTTSFGKDSVLA
jgi:hypothetical protein